MIMLMKSVCSKVGLSNDKERALNKRKRTSEQQLGMAKNFQKCTSSG